MIDSIKSRFSGLKTFSFSALALYLFIVFMLQAIENGAERFKILILPALLASLAISFFLFYFIGFIIERVNLVSDTYDKKTTLIITAVIFCISLAFYGIYFLCHYPGGYSVDTLIQIEQAVNGEYINWHPVLHTLLFFSLPIGLSSSFFPLIVILQIIYFCAAFSYLLMVLIKCGIKWQLLLLLCVYVWVNPFLAVNFMYPWKDLALTIFIIILIAYYVQIVLSKGVWLEKRINRIAFGVFTVLAAYMRHNAILLIAPFVILAFLYIRKNKKAIGSIIAIVAATVLLVQGLYSAIGVQKPDKRILETVGMPVTIWCSVMKHSPEALPAETRNKFYEIATKEMFEMVYVDGDFNSIKWGGMSNQEVIDKMSYGEVAKYTLQCFKYAPRASFLGFASLTSQVWGLECSPLLDFCYVDANPYGIPENQTSSLSKAFEGFCAVFLGSSLLKVLFGSYGFIMLILIATGLILLVKKRVAIIHIIPLLCYNFGTMLLLSGDDARFFIFNLPIWLVLLYLMFIDKTEFQIKHKGMQTAPPKHSKTF